MLIVWEKESKLDGFESKEAVIFRGKRSYRGVLQYNPDGIPCLYGCSITANSVGKTALYPLQENDILALPE